MECLHVGDPPSEFECWESKTIYIHNFLDLPDTKGDDNYVKSPEFKCFGHTWRLEVYPGGYDTADDGFVSVYIVNRSPEKISLDYRIVVLEADGADSGIEFDDAQTFEASSSEFEERHDAMGDLNLLERAKLVGNQYRYLDNGAFVIKVEMRLTKECYGNRIRQLSPNCDYIDTSFDDETSDIAFDLKGEIIMAHKFIIKSKAKDFYVMCEEYSDTSPMSIADVNQEIFVMMLKTLYGAEIYPEEWKKHSESILKAASKYGFSALESEAEAWYSKTLTFTVENVIDKFMAADGNNYAGVKAAAKKFIMEHGKEVVGSDSFDRLRESSTLMREVMAAAFENNNKRKRDEEYQYDVHCIKSLEQYLFLHS